MSLLMLIRKNFYGISGIILLDRYYDLCTFVFFNASYIHTQMCLLFNFISKYMLTVVAYLVAISCAEFRQCSGAVLEARHNVFLLLCVLSVQGLL